MMLPRPAQLDDDVPALDVVAACAAGHVKNHEVNCWALHAWHQHLAHPLPQRADDAITDWTMSLLESTVSPDGGADGEGSHGVVAGSPPHVDHVIQAAVRRRRLRPRGLRELDAERGRIDRETAAKLQAIADQAITRFLKRAGMKVQASVRDPEISSRLSEVDLEEVPVFARSIQLRPGLSIAAAAKVDFEKVLDEAMGAAVDAARKTLLQADIAIMEAFFSRLGDLRGATAVSRTERLDNAAAAFERVVRGAAMTAIGDTGDPAFELGAQVRPRTLPPADLLPVMSEAGGTEPGRRAGLHATGDVWSEELVATAKAAMRVVAATEPDVKELARQIAKQMLAGATLASRRTWAYGLNGTAMRPFKPHQDLDGLDSEHPDIVDANSPFDDQWYPGDHRGCTCGWDIVTELQL